MKQIQVLRHAPFQNTYKNLRTRLCELQIKMLQTEFPSAAADELLNTLVETLEFCEESTRQEEACILSRLQDKAAAMAAELAEEHEQEEDLMARLRYLVKRWQQTHYAPDAQAILFGLSDFTAFKLVHLNREQRELMPILWQHYNDKELKCIEQEMYTVKLHAA